MLGLVKVVEGRQHSIYVLYTIPLPILTLLEIMKASIKNSGKNWENSPVFLVDISQEIIKKCRRRIYVDLSQIIVDILGNKSEVY